MLKTKGIVIREMKYQETSKIITILTEKKGKVSVLAKGAYNPKSKLISQTQIFSLNEYQLRQGKNFYFISQADIIDSYYSIRENIGRLIYGYYILELADKSLPMEEESKSIYNLLVKGLDVLSRIDRDFLRFIIAYEIKFISFLGYRPYLEACVNCGEKEAKTIKFSIDKGGIICDRCFSSDRFSEPISGDIYRIMVESLYSKLDELEKIKSKEGDLVLAHDILTRYILEKIDRKYFNSLKFLEGLDLE